MAEWLSNVLVAADPDRPRPDFARQSALNWMAALDAEVRAEHGASVAAQRESCRAHFARTAEPRHVQGDTTAVLAATFEPLYAAVIFATSLLSRARQGTTLPPWHAPGAIVEWYYASYNALRSMLAATGTTVKDTHMAVAGALNDQLRARLPHPFDMVAEWDRNEEFTPSLPTHPHVRRATGGPSPLTETFDGTSAHARDMLLSYLKGTADYYVEDVKDGLLSSKVFRDEKLANFRTKRARELRDARLRDKEYNFVHLAFRYRGKANYRDFIYLAYGAGQLADARPFVAEMAGTARFLVVAALAYAERRLGEESATQFRRDLQANFRGTSLLAEDLP